MPDQQTIPETSYRFDWTTNPASTDNARYSKTLQSGAHNHIWVDGKEFKGDTPDTSPIKIQTGKNGWVLVYDVDTKKEHRIVAGILLKKKVHGHVVYKDDRIDNASS